jgi:hypothetical protein
MDICTPADGAAAMEHCVAFNVAKMTLVEPPFGGSGVVGPLNCEMVGLGGDGVVPT